MEKKTKKEIDDMAKSIDETNSIQKDYKIKQFMAMSEVISDSVSIQKKKYISKTNPQRKSGTRNKKCPGCGHKEKKCTCLD